MRRRGHNRRLGAQGAARANVITLDRHPVGVLRDAGDDHAEADAIAVRGCEAVDQRLRATDDVAAQAVFLGPREVEGADAVAGGNLLGLARATRERAAEERIDLGFQHAELARERLVVHEVEHALLQRGGLFARPRLGHRAVLGDELAEL